MKKVILGLVVVLVFGGVIFWQHQTISKLRAQNASLEAAAAELDLLRDEVDDLKKNQVSEEALERARQSQSELLRLRGEVSQLRDQLKKERLANQAAAAARAVAPAAPVAEEVAPPVENFTATLQATMAPRQMLVTGGWLMPNGKRAIMLMEPALAGNSGEAQQVLIQAKIVEMTEDAFNTAGLAGMRLDGKATATQSVLEAEQARLLTESLLTTPGVNVLSAPRVSTLDGQQARIQVTTLKTIDGNQYEVGPSIDIVPKVSPDGMTMDMTINAQLRMESNAQK